MIETTELSMTMRQRDEKTNKTSNTKHSMKNGVNEKPHRGKCDLGPDFVAPDGGFGWLVLIASGCSNVSEIIAKQ